MKENDVSAMGERECVKLVGTSLSPPQSTKRPLYRELASTIQAMRNCIAQGMRDGKEHPWARKHEERIQELVSLLPSGSGIDHGTAVVLDECTAGKLVFCLGFHHMNEHGMYDGWTDHRLVVTPSFDGIDMKISGRDRNGIKEYLYETYHWALTQEV